MVIDSLQGFFVIYSVLHTRRTTIIGTEISTFHHQILRAWDLNCV